MHRLCLLMLSALERGGCSLGTWDQELVFWAPWKQQRSAAPCPGHAIKLGTEWERSLLKQKKRLLFLISLLA